MLVSQPPPEEVRQRAHDVLARAEFARHESLVRRFLDWLNDLLNKVSFGAGGGSGFLGSLVGLLVIAAAITLLVVLVRALLGQSRLPKPPKDDELTIDLEDDRDAIDWRTDAERFEAAGQWREAMRARYRELVRSLIDDRVLTDIPGRTTGEYRAEFARARPEQRHAFDDLTDLFERVWYGGVETGADDNVRFRRLADEARARERVGT